MGSESYHDDSESVSPAKFALRCLRELREGMPEHRASRQVLEHYLQLIIKRMDVFYPLPSPLLDDRELRHEIFLPPQTTYERIDYYHLLPRQGASKDQEQAEHQKEVTLSYALELPSADHLYAEITLFNGLALPQQSSLILMSEVFQQTDEFHDMRDAYFHGELISSIFFHKIAKGRDIYLDGGFPTALVTDIDGTGSSTTFPQPDLLQLIDNRFFPQPK